MTSTYHQLTTGRSEGTGPMANLFINPPGAVNVTGPANGRPVHNLTTDALVGIYTKENAIQYIDKHKLTRSQEFFLTQVMPEMDAGEGLEIAWTTWEFQRDFAKEVPEETVSDLVGAAAHKKKVALTRLGKAAQISLDVMETLEGRTAWEHSLGQVINTFKHSQCVDGLRSILCAPDFRATLLMHTYGSNEKPYDLQTIFDRETEMFGGLSKNAWMMDKAVSEGIRLLQDRNITADVVLMPQGSKQFYLNSEENLVNRSTWQIEGQTGVDRQMNYLYDNELGNTIQGIQAVEMSAFIPSGTSTRIDPLTKEVTIGTKTILSGSAYGQGMRGTYVQDIDTDNFKYISMRTAFDRSRLFTVDAAGKGTIIPAKEAELKKQFGNPADVKFTSIAGFKFRGTGNINTAGGAKARADLEWTNYDHWVALINEGEALPLNFMIVRPRIRFEMSSAVVMRKGSETCNMFTGYKRADVGKNVEKGILYTNYVMRTKAAIMAEDAIHVIPNIKFHRYIGGGNFDDMFGDDLSKSHDDLKELAMQNLKATMIGRKKPSAMYMAVPATHTAQQFSFVDIMKDLKSNPVYKAAGGHISASYDPDQAFGTYPMYKDVIAYLFPATLNMNDLSNCDQSKHYGVTSMFQCMQIDILATGRQVLVHSHSHITDELSVPKSRSILDGSAIERRASDSINWTKILNMCPAV